MPPLKWVDGNIRLALDDEVSVDLLEAKARAVEILSMAFCRRGEHQDAGAKVIHAAPRTTSMLLTKSV